MTRYALATLVLFLVHLPGVFLFRGEFTDGVLQTVYFDEPIYAVGEGVPPAKYVPPLYPALIVILSKSGMDRLEAGRLISLIAYCGTALALAAFARRFGGRLSGTFGAEGLGWIAWSFWAASPMANRWAFHSMTDMTFCLFATLSIVAFLRATMNDERDPTAQWLLGNLWALAGVWTRYQGYALLGASALSLVLLIHRASQKADADNPTGLARFLTHRNIVAALLLMAAWTQTIQYQQQGRTVHEGQFAERAVYDFSLYLNFATAGLRYFPDAVGHPLFVLFLIGIWGMLRSGGRGAIWTAAGMLGGVAGLIVQTRFLSFQFRYGLPLLPWVCVFAAIGVNRLPWKWAYPGGGFTLVFLTAYSGAVLYFQHGTFADLEAASRNLAGLVKKDAQVWAREEYNFKPDGSIRYANVKTSVWSGVPVRWLDERSIEELGEGDLILDSNIAPIPPEFWRAIRARWKSEAVIEETAESLPLTPGEILWIRHRTPQGERLIRATSDPELMKHRFRKQYYSTSVHRLSSPHSPTGGGVSSTPRSGAVGQ